MRWNLDVTRQQPRSMKVHEVMNMMLLGTRTNSRTNVLGFVLASVLVLVLVLMATASKAQNQKRLQEVEDDIDDLKQQLKTYLKGGMVGKKHVELYLQSKTILTKEALGVLENTNNIVNVLTKLAKREERLIELSTVLIKQEEKNVVYQSRKRSREDEMKQLRYNLRSSPPVTQQQQHQHLNLIKPEDVEDD
jgi:cell division protein FtsB